MNIIRRFKRWRRRARFIKQLQHEKHQAHITSSQVHVFYMWVADEYNKDRLPRHIYERARAASEQIRAKYWRLDEKLDNLRNGLDWEFI